MDSRDVIVVGTGPAGLAAARKAGEAGLSVLLIDEQGAPGGQVWRNAERMGARPGLLGQGYRGADRAISGLPGTVEHMPGASLLDAAQWETGAGHAVRVTWLGSGPEGRGIRETTARALVVATGAMERPMLFPGAVLPGVMGVGAVQSVLKQSGMVPKGGGVVLAGQGPLLLLTLCQLIELGASVDAVLDLSPKGSLAGAAGLLPAALALGPRADAPGRAVAVAGTARRSALVPGCRGPARHGQRRRRVGVLYQRGQGGAAALFRSGGT